MSQGFMKYAMASVIAGGISTGNLNAQVNTPIDTTETEEGIEVRDLIFGHLVETQAIPQGGYAAFFEALSKHIKYPKTPQ